MNQAIENINIARHRLEEEIKEKLNDFIDLTGLQVEDIGLDSMVISVLGGPSSQKITSVKLNVTLP